MSDIVQPVWFRCPTCKVTVGVSSSFVAITDPGELSDSEGGSQWGLTSDDSEEEEEVDEVSEAEVLTPLDQPNQLETERLSAGTEQIKACIKATAKPTRPVGVMCCPICVWIPMDMDEWG